MVVVKVFMWPGGDESQERLMSVMTLACKGELKGERRYEVRAFKDAAFLSDPQILEDPAALHRGAREHLWRTEVIRGHFPGPRGVWDLVGGALKVTLGDRLARYRRSVLRPSSALPRRRSSD